MEPDRAARDAAMARLEAFIGEWVIEASFPDGYGGSGRVWVVKDNGTADPVDVRLGASDENSSQVLGGALQEGQQLAVGVATPHSRVNAFGLRLGF